MLTLFGSALRDVTDVSVGQHRELRDGRFCVFASRDGRFCAAPGSVQGSFAGPCHSRRPWLRHSCERTAIADRARLHQARR